MSKDEDIKEMQDNVDSTYGTVGDIGTAYENIIVKKGTNKIVGYISDDDSLNGAVPTFDIPPKLYGYYANSIIDYDSYKKDDHYHKVYDSIKRKGWDEGNPKNYTFGEYIGDYVGDITKVLFDKDNKDFKVNVSEICSDIDGGLGEDVSENEREKSDRIITAIKKRIFELKDNKSLFFSEDVLKLSVSVMESMLKMDGASALSFFKDAVKIYNGIGLKGLEIDKYDRMTVDDFIRMFMMYFIFEVATLLLVMIIMPLFKPQNANRKINNFNITAANEGERNPDLRVDERTTGLDDETGSTPRRIDEFLGIAKMPDNTEKVRENPKQSKDSVLDNEYDNFLYGDREYRNDNEDNDNQSGYESLTSLRLNGKPSGVNDPLDNNTFFDIGVGDYGFNSTTETGSFLPKSGGEDTHFSNESIANGGQIYPKQTKVPDGEDLIKDINKINNENDFSTDSTDREDLPTILGDLNKNEYDIFKKFSGMNVTDLDGNSEVKADNDINIAGDSTDMPNPEEDTNLAPNLIIRTVQNELAKSIYKKLFE